MEEQLKRCAICKEDIKGEHEIFVVDKVHYLVCLSCVKKLGKVIWIKLAGPRLYSGPEKVV